MSDNLENLTPEDADGKVCGVITNPGAHRLGGNERRDLEAMGCDLERALEDANLSGCRLLSYVADPVAHTITISMPQEVT